MKQHLLLLQCAEITVMGKRKGWETRDGEKKKYTRGSLLVAAQHGAASPSCQCSGASLMHTHTHTRRDVVAGLLEWPRLGD